MKKLLSLLTAFGILSFSFVSQAQSNGKVNGTVSGADKAVESASVALVRVKDSAMVKMAVSDKAGQFAIEKVANGRYRVMTQSLGFVKFYSEAFEISEASPSYTVKPIVLQTASRELSGVTVVSQRPFVEQKVDRTIINVDATPSNTGTTVMELLEKSPGISVDKDGNISLKGKQGVMVMMDGKPTYLSSADLANMLKGMPSANLDQIEIMTNPPAKFDASGNSGVINIKTKKTKTMGYNGSVTASYAQGIYPKASLSANLNYRHNKLNFFGNASTNYSENFGDLYILRRFRDKSGANVLSVFDQNAHSMRDNKGLNYKAGVDYFMSRKTTLGVVVTGYDSRNTELVDNVTLINNASGALTTRTQAVNDMKSFFRNVGVNINGRHVFDSAGKELTMDLDYVNYSSGADQLLSNLFYDNAGNKQKPDELLKGNIPSDINIYSGKLDYLQPLKNGSRFEAGLKSSYVSTDNNAQYANWNNTAGKYDVDIARSNHFLYRENINAAYLNLSKQLTKVWGAQLGLRMENTNIRGNQLTSGQTFTRSYTQVFPTAYLSFTPGDKHQFGLSYGRRIDRPNYQDLNPFYNFLDKYTYQVGNPYLNPQFSHNIELNHTYRGFLTTSLNYSTTNDIIQEVLEQVDSTNTSFIKKANIAKRQSFGVSVSLNAPVTKWFRTSVYLNAFNNKFSGIVNGGYIEVNGSSFMANVNNQFSFPKGWGGELSGFYRSPQVQGVLASNDMWGMNLGISKQVMKNKGSIRLVLRDVFLTQIFSGYSKYQNIDVSIRQQRDSRQLNLSFSYRFNKGKTVQQRKRNTVDETNRVGGGNN
ncbi:outer membrane beta-barrel family protein [Sediminibacterium soli]|uniref:outer membrane beta-barrel family protein n=1 Tax=Sediminibacterium soli TaxID=2698829 RepID=UPI00137B9265|nr:outer membrane beta-barrel family protein [Sediminibacterium soli]NCI46378.1 TonB-dependent receptor [Sediminibacterium soli]